MNMTIHRPRPFAIVSRGRSPLSFCTSSTPRAPTSPASGCSTSPPTRAAARLTITFKQDGEKLTGKYAGQLGQRRFDGNREGTPFTSPSRSTRRAQPAPVTYDGAVEKNTMKGQARHRRHGERHVYRHEVIQIYGFVPIDSPSRHLLLNVLICGDPFPLS